MNAAQRAGARRAPVRSVKSATPFAFWRSWWQDPVAVGLPFESSPWTARRLAEATLDAAIPGGPVLERGSRPTDVVVVERDAHLCRLLERRFRGVRVLHGDALHLGELLGKAGLSSIGAVLSGLPMRAIPGQAAADCYAEAFRCMPAGGAIIQYTYGFRPPVDPTALRSLEATFVGREWRNVPAVAIWRYRLARPEVLSSA
jgi:phosphatidylethanolamine/phosphatidyl-N-methylethanolamine N-methyltransferase